MEIVHTYVELVPVGESSVRLFTAALVYNTLRNDRLRVERTLDLDTISLMSRSMLRHTFRACAVTGTMLLRRFVNAVGDD